MVKLGGKNGNNGTNCVSDVLAVSETDEVVWV
jgi:hypothetical protein